MVVSSSREKASGPTGCECAISTMRVRRDQIASQRARESGSATGESDASDQRTTSFRPTSKQTSRTLRSIHRLSIDPRASQRRARDLRNDLAVLHHAAPAVDLDLLVVRVTDRATDIDVELVHRANDADDLL